MEVLIAFIIYWYVRLIHDHSMTEYQCIVHGGAFVQLQKVPIEELLVVYNTPAIRYGFLIFLEFEPTHSHWFDDVFVRVITLDPFLPGR